MCDIVSVGLVFTMAILGTDLLSRDVHRDAGISNVRSQFASGVSHELRTPLAAIRMFAETLRRRPEDDPAHELPK